MNFPSQYNLYINNIKLKFSTFERVKFQEKIVHIVTGMHCY